MQIPDFYNDSNLALDQWFLYRRVKQNPAHAWMTAPKKGHFYVDVNRCIDLVEFFHLTYAHGILINHSCHLCDLAAKMLTLSQQLFYLFKMLDYTVFNADTKISLFWDSLSRHAYRLFNMKFCLYDIFFMLEKIDVCFHFDPQLRLWAEIIPFWSIKSAFVCIISRLMLLYWILSRFDAQ